MAVTFDAASSVSGGAAGATGVSWTHTVGEAGAYVVAGISVGAGDVTATLNSTAMTLLETAANTPIGTNIYTYAGFATTSGAKTIAAHWSGSYFHAAVAVSFNGMSQAAPTTGLATSSGTSSSPTVSAPGSSDGIALGFLVCASGAAPQTTGAGVTQRAIVAYGGGSSSYEVCGTATGANVAWGLTGSQQWIMSGVRVIPDPAYVEAGGVSWWY